MKIFCVFIVGLSICGAGIIKRYIFIINASLPFFLFAFTCVVFIRMSLLVFMLFIFGRFIFHLDPSPNQNYWSIPTSFDIARTLLKR